MKRKLAPLVSCPELRHFNKTMIIEIPPEFRERSHPHFRIVSSSYDLDNPRVKFKANEILKTIIEKGTAAKKWDTICMEGTKGNSLKSTELLHEKSSKQLSNSIVSSEGYETKICPQKLSGGYNDPNCAVVSSPADNNSKQIASQFSHSSKNSSVEPSHSYKGLGAHMHKTSLGSVEEQHLPVFKNSQNTSSEYKKVQQLPKPAYLVPQEQEIVQHNDTKMFGKLGSHNWHPCKDSEDFGASRGVNDNVTYGSSRKTIDQDGLTVWVNHGSDFPQVISESDPVTTQKWKGFAFRTAQSRYFRDSQEIDHCKDHRSIQQKAYQKLMSLHQKNLALRRNCNFQLSEGCDSGSLPSGQKPIMPPDALFQHPDFGEFHQCLNYNNESVNSSNQNGIKSSSQHCDSGLKNHEQQLEYGDSSWMGAENALGNKSSSWSMYSGLNVERSKPGRSALGYNCNKNDQVLHQEEQKQRIVVQASRFSNKNKHQVANENLSFWKKIYKSADEFPGHCFWKGLNWSEMKQILFLDVSSYPSFFCNFEKIPPLGMHIWIFMHPTFKLKYPNELVNHRLINMKFLHIVLGDSNVTLPEEVYDIHHRLPPSAQFIIVSNRQFTSMETIKHSRTVHLVHPKFGDGMSEIYRYVFKADV